MKRFNTRSGLLTGFAIFAAGALMMASTVMAQTPMPTPVPEGVAPSTGPTANTASSSVPSGSIPPGNIPPGLPPSAGPGQPGAPAVAGDNVSLSGQTSVAHDQQSDANAFGKLEDALNAHTAVTPPSTHPEDLKTLFYTAWQYALLNEAKQLFNGRPPSASEIKNDTGQKPSGPREIALGGISFRNTKSWTVWLNNERIKPDAIPSEILDIKVSSDHVDLKWYDNSTNLIFPIRLRPHQRFNLDDRIFLPGTGT